MSTYLWVAVLLTKHSQFNTKRHLAIIFPQKYQCDLYMATGCVVLCSITRQMFKKMRAVHEAFFQTLVNALRRQSRE